MRYFRNLFGLLFLTAGVIITSCVSTPMEEHGEKRTNRPDQESWDVTITMTNEGLVRAIVQSGYLKKFQQKNFIFLEDSVTVDFFDQSEIHTTHLTSQSAEINEKSNFMRATQSVVVKSDSGVTLFTDTLSWDHSKQRIFTYDSVQVVTDKRDTLYGVGFESDVEMKHWKILMPSGVTNRMLNE
ncbi:MAG: LPS export ABC transporter periplasmic protein LptC [Candidatus Marinimicrobia bacterium]|nr:LPS export ABC transporter periplasmic protein LptC [Candidatus Neomarinimicrobiota bacterium]